MILEIVLSIICLLSLIYLYYLMLKTKETITNPEEEFLLDDLFLYTTLFNHGKNRFCNMIFSSNDTTNSTSDASYIISIIQLHRISKLKIIIKFLYKYKLNIPIYEEIVANKNEDFLYNMYNFYNIF